jgi:hypothetical protein
MSDYDLLFRGGTLVTAEGLISADLAVFDGQVVATGSELKGRVTELVDASGLHLFQVSWMRTCTLTSLAANIGKALFGAAFIGGRRRDNLL